MCGIAGYAGRSGHIASDALERAAAALFHRGPDDGGVQRLDVSGDMCVGFASRRLAILDLSPAGHQPMRDERTGNWIVYNGEVYNFRALRTELQSAGIAFHSDCDTEVVLKAYGLWGDSFLQRLRGMFGFAIYDAARQRVLLVRDRLGKKPVYYRVEDACLVFASELRALLEIGAVKREINCRAVADYLAFGSVQDPETIIAGVRALRPGHGLSFENGVARESCYWTLPAQQQEKPVDAATSRVSALLDEAVSLRLVSDVPIGVFLSGGIDSSAIVAVLARLGVRQVGTFSLVFQESEFDEGDYSRLIAKRFQTEHHEKLLSADEALAAVPAFIAAMDQPTIDGLNTYLVSREAKRAGFKVALSGVGGDELFAGYSTFRTLPKLLRLRGLSQRMPAGVRRAAAVSLRRAGGRGGKLSAVVSETELHPYAIARALFVPARRSELFGQLHSELQDLPPAELDAVNQVSHLELRHYMLNTLLRDTDVMSMAHSLEVRTPLLDHKLVDFVFALAGKSKLRRDAPKALLVEALGGTLPDEVVFREKRGFTLPMEDWLRTALRADVERALTRPDGPLASLLQHAAVTRVWRDFLAGRMSWSRPWSLYVLDRWLSYHVGQHEW